MCSWKSKKVFMKYANEKRKKCSLNIIPTLVHSSGDDEEGANWIISYYAKKYELQFIKVAQELGYNIKSKKMGASTAAEW